MVPHTKLAKINQHLLQNAISQFSSTDTLLKQHTCAVSDVGYHTVKYFSFMEPNSKSTSYC